MEAEKVAQDYQVWYADETSIHQNPNSMYGWQKKDAAPCLPAKRGAVLNILGFITKDLQKAFYEFNESMSQEIFILTMDNFIEKYVTKKTILILDKASFHTGKLVIDKIAEWRKKNLFIQFLPTASAELNPIETLWKFVKHHWLSVLDWQSAQKLREKALFILNNIGNQYKIHFKT